MVSQTTTRSSTDASIRSSAGGEKSACVAHASTRSAPGVGNGLGGVAERARRVDHVVGDDRDLALDVADQRHHARLAVPGALLVDERELAAEHLGELLRELDTAGVRRDDDEPVLRQPLIAEVLREHRQRRHVVDRDVEEALHLAGVQIHGEHAVDTCGLQDVGHEARADRLARRRLLVGPRVGIPRHHRRDPLGRRELRRVHHQQQLHQVPVHRARARLDEEHVGAADRLAEAHVQLAVRERLELDLAKRQSEMLADRVRQIGVRTPREHHHPAYGIAIVVARHRTLLRGVDRLCQHELVSEEARRAHGFDHGRAPSSRRAATCSA